MGNTENMVTTLAKVKNLVFCFFFVDLHCNNLFFIGIMGALHVSETQVFKILKSKFTEQEAEVLVRFFEKNAKDELDRSKHTLATREDIRHLENKLENRITTAYGKIMWAIGLAVPLIIGTIMGFVYTLQSQTNTQIYNLQTQTNAQIGRIDRQFEMIDQRFEQINQRFEKMNDKIDQRFDQLFLLMQSKR